MAITVTNKGFSSSTSQATIYTATITAPTSGRVQLAFILSSKASLPDTPSSLVSTGLTWQLIATVAFGPISGPLRRLSAWRAQGTSSDTTVDINFPATQTGCGWCFVELNGVDTTGVAGANAIADSTVASADGVGSLTNILDLGGIVFTGDAAIAAFGVDQNVVITPAEGWTETGEASWITPTAHVQTQYHLTYDATPAATWTNIPTNAGGIALELKAIENAFKSNPKPGELVTLSEALPIVNLITAAQPPLVIPLQSDTVQVSEAAPTVERWQREWYGAANLLDEPQRADSLTISEGTPLVTVIGYPNPNVADMVTLTDILTVKGLMLVIPETAAADLVTAGENLVGPLLAGTAIFLISVNDSTTLTDTPTPNLISQPQPNDLLTLGETRTVQILNQPQAADTTTLNETLALQLIIEPQAADTLTVSDTITVTGLTLLIPADQLVTVGDSTQTVIVGVIPIENFDDNITNTGFWSVSASSATTDALVLVNETSHQLAITPRSNAGAVNSFNGYRAVYPSNYTDTGVFAEVPQVANSATSARTGLFLSIDTANSFDITQEGGQLYFEYRVANVVNETHIPYNAALHRWWRIRHVSAGDTIRFDTSATGTPNSWTEQRNIPRPAALPVTALSIGLQAGTYASVASPGVAIFDNVNTTTLTGFPADAVTLTDTRTVRGLILKPVGNEVVTLSEVSLVAFAGTLVKLVADQITLGEFAEAELIAPMSDTVTVTDTATANLLEMPRSAESVTISEPPTVVSLLEMPRIAESVTLSDDRTVTVGAIPPLIIPVADAVTLTDVVTITGLILKPLATDVLTLSEVRLVALGTTLVKLVGDSLTVTDSSQAELWMDAWGGTINLLEMPHSADLVTLSEPPTVVTLIGAGGQLQPQNVNDQVTLTDAAIITGLILPIPAADLITLNDSRIVSLTGAGQINVPDSVTLADTLTVRVVMLRPFAEDVVFLVDDRLVISANTLVKSVGDLVSLTDVVIMEPILPAHDDVFVTDSATVIIVSGIWLINVADSITLTDTRTITGLILYLPAADNLTLTEFISVSGLTLPTAAADLVTLSETPALQLVHEPQPAETLTSTDVVTVKGLIPAIATGDSITLPDVVAITGLTLTIPAADLITLNDNRTVIAALPGVWQISSADSVTLAETSTVTGLILKPITAESVTLTETPTTQIVHKLQAIESVTLTETVTVKGLINRVATGEVITLSDVATWQLSKLLIARGDTVTLTESRNLSFVDQFISEPLIVFTVPARDMTVTATVGITQFVVPARNLTVEAAANPLVFTVPARNMSVTATIGITQFVVAARDFTMVAAA